MRVVSLRASANDEAGRGHTLAVADGAALTGLYFPHHWYMPDVDTFRFKAIERAAGRDPHPSGKRSYREYLSGERRTLECHRWSLRWRSISPNGLWKLLREIPLWADTTYGALAMNGFG
jgi:methylated-DNA-[protein]-cysteine S-methyltransferase